MLVPLSWLREYVDIPVPTPKLAERLTLAGLEEASLTNTGDLWEEDKIVVGQVAAVLPHPDADRLALVDVAHESASGAGEPPLQRVVTGAPNLFQYKDRSLSAGDLPVLKVAFAREGALLNDAYSDKLPRPRKRLKKAKIRGVESRGMVCSELELGLSEEHEGILLLPDDAPVGMPLRHFLGDEILEIDLTPDMARCLSMWGVAREVQALTGGALHLPEDVDASDGEDIAEEYVSAQIEDPDLCQRFTGTVLRDIKVGESPKWLAGPAVQRGYAAHKQHRRYNKLCHVGIGPAASRIRLRSSCRQGPRNSATPGQPSSCARPGKARNSKPLTVSGAISNRQCWSSPTRPARLPSPA